MRRLLLSIESCTRARDYSPALARRWEATHADHRTALNTARTLTATRSESAIDFGSPQRPEPIFESGRDLLHRVSSTFSNRDNELQPFAASDAVNGSPSRPGGSSSGGPDGFDIDENFSVDPLRSTPSPRKRMSPLKRGRTDDEEAESDGMAVDGEEDECELTDVEDGRPPSPTPGARGSSWRGSGNSSARTLGRSRTAPEAFVTNAQF